MIKLMKRAREHFVTLTETAFVDITCICGHCTDLAATCALAPLHVLSLEQLCRTQHFPL